jgi:aspartyl-tRNA(Asn)/glutamyl-tRNA(Gln) amidotransferase subunit A
MSETHDLGMMDASQLNRLFRTKAASPVEATMASLKRIDKFNSDFNAYCFVDHESAVADARQSEARWLRNAPLSEIDGVSASIKDILLTKGWPTRRGSRSTVDNQEWNEDAPAVARLREAGAILLGKTTTPEFGWKGVCDSPLTGVTRNPWRPEMTSGGSSGGAAVAAAHKLGVLHLGTDGGGSIRIPASFSGIFGIKPTFGMVPAYPLSRFGTIAHLGPMTCSVADAAQMLAIISRPDRRDWHSLPYPREDLTTGLNAGVKGLRVALTLTLGFTSADPEVSAVVREAAKVFSDLGAIVDEDHPDIGDPTETFRAHWYSGAANQRRHIPKADRDRLDEGFNMIADMGERIPLAEYCEAMDRRAEIGLRSQEFFQNYDLLLTPTVAIPAFKTGQVSPDINERTDWMSWTPFTYPFNLTQQPAASIPCGFTSQGLPIGLQIVSAKYRDDIVLAASRAYESARPIQLPNLS